MTLALGRHLRSWLAMSRNFAPEARNVYSYGRLYKHDAALRRRRYLKGARMKLPKLTAVIEKEGKWYVATCPELGVASQGRSFEEAEAMIVEAVELLLE